jgi:autotransporter-associated beta strand protein
VGNSETLAVTLEALSRRRSGDPCIAHNPATAQRGKNRIRFSTCRHIQAMLATAVLAGSAHGARAVVWNDSSSGGTVTSSTGLTDQAGVYANTGVFLNSAGYYGTATYLANGWVLCCRHVVEYDSNYGVITAPTNMTFENNSAYYGTAVVAMPFSSECTLTHLVTTPSNVTQLSSSVIFTGSAATGTIVQVGGFGLNGVIGGTATNNETFHRAYNVISGVSGSALSITLADNSNLDAQSLLMGGIDSGDSGSPLLILNGANSGASNQANYQIAGVTATGQGNSIGNVDTFEPTSQFATEIQNLVWGSGNSYKWSRGISGTFSWNNSTSNGDVTNGNNWNSSLSQTFPIGAGDLVDLSSSMGASIQTIHLDQNISLGELTIGDTTASSTGIQTLAAGGSYTLTFSNPSMALLTHTPDGNADVISAPIVLAGSGLLQSYGSSNTALSLSGGLTSGLSSGTQTLENVTGPLVVSGVIGDGTAGGHMGVTVDAGTLTLSATNSYSGATNINGGNLQLGAGATLGNNASTNTISLGGGILELLSGIKALGSNQAITLTANSTIQTDSGSTLTIPTAVTTGGNTLTASGAGSATFTASITGTGGVTQSGTGTATLAATSTYSGATTVTGGTLAISGALANSAVNVSGGTLRLSAANAITQNTLTFSGGALSESAMNDISGSAAIVVQSNLTLTGSDNFTGTTTINAGTNVVLTITSATGAGNGGELSAATGATTPTINLHINGGGTIAMNNGFGGNSAITTTINVDNNGSGANGVIQLNGATSNYGGGDTLNVTGGDGYSLYINHITNTAGASAVTTTLNPTTANLSIGTLTGGSLSGNSYTLGGTSTGNAITNLYNGSSATAVIKSGTSTWAISGSETCSGTTVINGGTLLINGNASAATGAVTVNAGGALGGSGTLGGATTISASGTLSPGSSLGVLTFSNSTGNTLTLASGSASIFGISGTTRGTQYDGVNISTTTGTPLTCGGALTAVFAAAPGLGSTTYDLFQFTAMPSGSFNSVTMAGLFNLPLTDIDNVWAGTSGNDSFTFTQATGDLVVTAVPEPSSAALFAVTTLALLPRRHRRARV